MAKQLGCFVKEARSYIEEWDAESAHERLAQGDVLVIDVREHDELTGGRIAGALHIPRGILEVAADPSIKYRHPVLSQAQQRTILLYCKSGARSALAAWTLKQMGFERVYSLAGGLECWEAEGFELSDASRALP